MKKQPKKLVISKETLSQLAVVRGGTEASTSGTAPNTIYTCVHCSFCLLAETYAGC